MRHKFLLVLLGMGIACVSFWIGRVWRDGEEVQREMDADMKRYDTFADFDKTVLQTFPARSNTLKSGPYLMDLRIPTVQSNGVTRIFLQCENGQISIPHFRRNGDTETLSVTGNVVSWTGEGVGYEANEKYVGLIDGDEMWGRVYGWGPGDQSVGLWRIYPLPLNQQKDAANGSH